MKTGDRVVYIAPFPMPGRRSFRPGEIKAILGQSALVLFDDCLWAQGAPLTRLHPATPGADGWGQLHLFREIPHDE